MLESLFINILSSLIFEIGKVGFAKILKGSPIKNAIKATASAFPSLIQVESSLTVWCESDDFVKQIAKLTGTIDEVDTKALADSFCSVGGFYDNVHLFKSAETAIEVLSSFFERFEQELYASEHAHYIEATKAKLRQREIRSDVRDLSSQSREQTKEIIKHQSQGTAEIKAYIDEKNDVESSTKWKENVSFQSIDFAVDLLRDGKPHMARERLLTLQEKILTENVSIDLRFRAIANLGLCSFHLDDLETAQSEFEEALVLKPNHQLIKSHLALVLSLNGDFDRALEHARSASFAQEHASVINANYVRTMHQVGAPQKIWQLIEAEVWVEGDPNCALSLGLVAFDEGNYQKSENYFRVAHAGDPQNAHAVRLLAQSILAPIDQILLENPPIFLAENLQALLKESEGYLTAAIKSFGSYENVASLRACLLQRAYVRDLLGDELGSLSDCDWLLRLDPRDDLALKQKGSTLLLNGKSEKALTSFLEISDEQTRSEAVLSTALAYIRTQNYPDVIRILEARLDTSDTARSQALLVDLLLFAYHRSQRKNEIQELVSILEKERGLDPEILIVIARQEIREKEKIKGIERYEKALALAKTDNQRSRIRLELADVYFDFREWVEASKYYSDEVDEDTDTQLSRRYLTALYNSGARDKALDLAKRIRRGGPAIPLISEIEAAILVALGEHVDALELYEQLAKVEPDKFSHVFAIIENYIEIGSTEKARALTEEVSFEAIKDDVFSLIRTADLRQKVDLGGSLPFAYRAREIGINEREVHQAFIQLFLSLPDAESQALDVSEVDLDCAVYLKNKRDELITYLIVDHENVDRQQGEISATDSRAETLRGLKVGDHVKFNEGKPNEVEYEVAEVKSKYVHAFQTSIKKYNEWFVPDTNEIVVMDVADGDFSALFNLLDQQGKQGQEAIERYREGQIPLALLARLRGKNLFETWGALVGTDSEIKIIVCPGDSEHLEQSRELSRTPTVILDIIPLFTLQMIGLLDKLSIAFSRIIIARRVYLELQKLSSDLADETPHSRIWGDKSNLFFGDITQENIENRQQFIREILSWIDDHVEIQTAKTLLTIPHDKLEKYEIALGPSLESLLLASEIELPLYVDDFNLSVVGRALGWKIDGFSTQTILLKFKSLGLISQVEYYKALKHLILANYGFISVNTDALWWMCKDEGRIGTDAMEKILHATLGITTTLESAVLVGSEFIRKVYLEVGNDAEKAKLIQSTLLSLFENRKVEEFRDKLKAKLNQTLRFSPKGKEYVFPLIDRVWSGEMLGTQSENPTS